MPKLKQPKSILIDSKNCDYENIKEVETLIAAIRKQLHKVSFFKDEKTHFEFHNNLISIENQMKEPVRLSFCGNFSVGKSEVINSLIGEQIAPTNVKKTTAVVCYFKYSDTKKVKYHLNNGESREEGIFSLRVFTDHSVMTAEEVKEIQQMSHAEVYFPSEVLRTITVVDTPGFGSDAEMDDAITEKHLRNADAVFWVFDANEFGKQDEVRRIEKLSRHFKNSFALINKCDEIHNSEYLSLRTRSKNLFGKRFKKTFLYSATLVLDDYNNELDDDDRKEYSELSFNLREEILEIINKNTTQIRIDRALGDIKKLTGKQKIFLEKKEKLINDMITFAEEDFDGFCDNKDEKLEKKLKRGRDKLKKNIEKGFRESTEVLKNSITEETWLLFFTDREYDHEAVNDIFDILSTVAEKAFKKWENTITKAYQESIDEIVQFLEVSLKKQKGIVKKFRKPITESTITYIRDNQNRFVEYALSIFSHIPYYLFQGMIAGFRNSFMQIANEIPQTKHYFAEEFNSMPMDEMYNFLWEIITFNDSYSIITINIDNKADLYSKSIREHFQGICSGLMKRDAKAISSLKDWMSDNIDVLN